MTDFAPPTLRYVLHYMLLTAPLNYLTHRWNVEVLDIFYLYLPIALVKIILSVAYLERLRLWHKFGPQTLVFSITTRLFFGAPWMIILIGSVIFLRGNRKKVI